MFHYASLFYDDGLEFATYLMSMYSNVPAMGKTFPVFFYPIESVIYAICPL